MGKVICSPYGSGVVLSFHVFMFLPVCLFISLKGHSFLNLCIITTTSDPKGPVNTNYTSVKYGD